MAKVYNRTAPNVVLQCAFRHRDGPVLIVVVPDPEYCATAQLTFKQFAAADGTVVSHTSNGSSLRWSTDSTLHHQACASCDEPWCSVVDATDIFVSGAKRLKVQQPREH